MLIVKPYGRSCTERDAGGCLHRRVLRATADGETSEEVAELAERHPELVIAQWVSAIDKVAAKPRGSRKPTREQRALREALGQAACKLLEKRGVFAERREELERLWRRKIHPYPNGEEERGGRPQGRWFKAFAGRAEPARIDAGAVARKIERHLHHRERRQGAPEKRAGRIAAQADSIARNAPRPPSDATPQPMDDPPWSEADRKRYAEVGDVAEEIANRARDLANPKDGDKARRASMRDAAPILYEQFGKLFRSANGAKPTVRSAREAEPGLFALHMAIKDTYTGLLKGRRTRDVAGALPKTMAELMRLVEARRGNRELAALIRLGKVVHYAAAPPGASDEPANVIDRWPDDIAASRYWTSRDQTEIKRNEALVRVWRGAIALAARTAKDWADPNAELCGDIASQGARKKVLGDGFNAEACRRKIEILFGAQSGILEAGEGKPLLELALEGLERLRHSAFHFKGRAGFAAALDAVGKCGSAKARRAARELWRADEDGRAARIRDTMRGAHFELFLDLDRYQAVFAAVSNPPPAHPPLPRFRRVLQRAENAWSKGSHWLRLPAPGNRAELEAPARLCQYTALKLLYERAFPAWLAGRLARALNAWIDRAAERATKDARSINRDPHAVAKIEGLARLRDCETVDDFLDRLAAATATEFRVQRGYDPDPDKAREQSRHLDNARLDVAAQAFEAYLEDAGFTRLLEDFGDPPEKPLFDIDDLSDSAASRADPDDWMAVLYVLVHLVPVGDVAALRHQLRKWTVLERKASPQVVAQVEAAGRVFDLYIDMHDAKFEGGRRMDGARALKDLLFESAEVFARVCPKQPDASGAAEDAGRFVPWRGLREILRFGALTPLTPIFAEHRIMAAEAERMEKAEAKDESGVSAIAASQKRREELHAKWVEKNEKKKRFSGRDREAYREALAETAAHRRRAAHVRLDNHARLHRLSMRILGRLVDFAGLWERDLYFTTLALIWRRGKRPGDVFDDDGLKRLREGRIVDALRRLAESPDDDSKAVHDGLQERFGEEGACFLDGSSGVVGVRNDLAHFNMLKKDRALDLTEVVNGARRLMAYDRKLKNAVSRSVMEMLRREGLDLSWEMKNHRLTGAEIAPRQAVHLGDRKIRENLHGREFVAMAAAMFDGRPRSPDGDDVLSVRASSTAANPGRQGRGRPKRRKPRNS